VKSQLSKFRTFKRSVQVACGAPYTSKNLVKFKIFIHGPLVEDQKSW